ncbi:hypothetical protein D3C73_1606350 [compost metagenome]
MVHAFIHIDFEVKIPAVADVQNKQIAADMLQLLLNGYNLPAAADADPEVLGQRANHGGRPLLLAHIHQMLDRA